MLAVSANHTFHIKRVSRTQRPSPCYRFTGFGDRPCDQKEAPLLYGWWPAWFWWLRHWNWSRVDSHNLVVYTDAAAVPVTISDFSWVEVLRYAPHVHQRGTDGGGYGIWHFLAVGSGVSVNVGRAIRFDDKHRAARWSESFGDNVEEMQCASLASSCTFAKDALLCAAARRNGFDSVITRDTGSQHTSPAFHEIIEIVVCPHGETREQPSACADTVEYRLGDGIRNCTCGTSQEMLGCVENGTNTTPSLVSYGSHPEYVLQIPLVLCLLATCLPTWRRCPSRAGRRIAPTVETTNGGGECVRAHRPLCKRGKRLDGSAEVSLMAWGEGGTERSGVCDCE